MPVLPPTSVEVVASAPFDACQALPTLPFPDHANGQARKILDLPQNSFGLFRRYFSQQFPSHDPESEVNLSSLSNIVHSNEKPPTSSYALYPNENSFRLGNWYWNHGVQKSQASFKELVSIVGDVDFQPSDIQSTNWGKINEQLAEGTCDEGEWANEEAGWTTSPVTIPVPFHRLTPNPGPRDYVVMNFHHRSLVSVIREKLTNENDAPHFHYDPYELLWQPHDNQHPVRIQGELYNSPAFIDAHNRLQDAPSEAGCDLPRVVVALMFWSDGTHLTNFGNAKLWPLYMFFGNESKYRRGKPSCNLCEHVAYFETVRIPFNAICVS